MVRIEVKSRPGYLDGLTVYAKSGTEHLIHVRIVLTLLPNAVVALRLSKTTFFGDTVSYLGHTIRPKKPAVNNKN